VDYVENLAECQEQCLDNIDECAAVDFVDDACYEISKEEYNEANLVDNQDSIHYYVVPC